mmetsp:Transcript_130026/g.277722  ORF Transcript_130026/g.277722 Transcript_130026/m.277722 type:complete len:235 (+) Transcript_130026:130-834(+)
MVDRSAPMELSRSVATSTTSESGKAVTEYSDSQSTSTRPPSRPILRTVAGCHSPWKQADTRSLTRRLRCPSPGVKTRASEELLRASAVFMGGGGGGIGGGGGGSSLVGEEGLRGNALRGGGAVLGGGDMVGGGGRRAGGRGGGGLEGGRGKAVAGGRNEVAAGAGGGGVDGGPTGGPAVVPFSSTVASFGPGATEAASGSGASSGIGSSGLGVGSASDEVIGAKAPPLEGRTWW